MRRVSQWTALAVIGLLGAWAVLGIVSGSAPRLGGAVGRAEAAEASVQAAATASRPVCDGDGESGDRVQALYVRASSGPDRFASMTPRFTEILGKADRALAAADGEKHVRFVHGSDCAPTVTNVTVPAAALGDLPRLTDALRTLGFARPDRTYVLWYEGAGCAATAGDYAVLGTSCWTSWRSMATQLQRIATAAFLVR